MIITNLWEYKFIIKESLAQYAATKIFYVQSQPGGFPMLVPCCKLQNKFYMKTDSCDCFSVKKVLVISELENDDPFAVLQNSLLTDTDLILIIKTGSIFNISAGVVHIDYVDYDTRNFMKILDTIDQPYPKDFAMNEDAFYKLYKTIDLNQNIDQLENGEQLLKGISKIYRGLGIDVCHTDIFRIEITKNGILPTATFNDKIFLKITKCDRKYCISGILLGSTKDENYRMILLLINSTNKKGYIFDPLCEINILPNIAKYVLSKLPDVKMITSLDVQNVQNVQNVLLSYYIGLLYIMNDKMSVDQIKVFLDPFVTNNSVAIITRFIMAMV